MTEKSKSAKAVEQLEKAVEKVRKQGYEVRIRVIAKDVKDDN